MSRTLNAEAMERRIGIANQALATFLPSVLLYRSREVRMCWDYRKQPPKHDFPARLREEGSSLAYGYRQRPCGGTGMQALAQLVRYIRDLPRLPIKTWNYWESDTVRLCSLSTTEILRNGGYEDPKMTCCVLCGCTEFKRGLDWWSLDGVVGPSCQYGTCKEARTAAVEIPGGRQ